MIVVEKYSDDLVRRYSDQGKMLHKIGTDEFYEEAIDLESSPYEYEEVEEDSDSDTENKD